MYEISILNNRESRLASALKFKSIEKLSEGLLRYAWSPLIYIDSWSTSEFSRTSMLVYDIDDVGFDDKSITLEEIKESTKDYSHIILDSNDGNKNPSYRVLIFFDNIITEKDTYDHNYEYYAGKLFTRKIDWLGGYAKDFRYEKSKVIVSCQEGKELRIMYPRVAVEKEPEVFNPYEIVRGSLAPSTHDVIRNGTNQTDWIERVAHACSDLREKGYPLEETYRLLEHASQKTFNKSLDDESIFVIREVSNKFKDKTPKTYKLLKNWTANDIKDNIVPGLNETFVVHKRVNGTKTIYVRKGTSNEVSEITEMDAVEDKIFQIAKEISERNNTNEMPSEKFIRESIFLWDKLGGSNIKDEPTPFCFKGEEVITLKQFDFALEQGPFKAWNEFLCRLSDPNAFMAYVWSALEKRNESRQALWIKGEGSDGKSTVFRALSDLFGVAAGALTNTLMTKGIQFALKALHNKRVVFYSDCVVTDFFKHEFLRNFTGNDIVPIEGKGDNAFFGNVYLKVFVASNLAPEILNQNAEKSRALFLTIKPSNNQNDPCFLEKLKSEIPHFLHECREQYKILCPNHGNIMLSNEVIKAVDELAEESNQDFRTIFDLLFVYSPDSTIPGEALWGALHKAKYFLNNTDKQKFKIWLKNSMNVESSRTNKGVRFKNILLKR